MAYEGKNLAVMAYAAGFTQWVYQTTDSFEEIMSDGYFDDANDMLRQGDWIQVSISHDDVLYSGAILIVAYNKAGTILVTQMCASINKDLIDKNAERFI